MFHSRQSRDGTLNSMQYIIVHIPFSELIFVRQYIQCTKEPFFFLPQASIAEVVLKKDLIAVVDVILILSNMSKFL